MACIPFWLIFQRTSAVSQESAASIWSRDASHDVFVSFCELFPRTPVSGATQLDPHARIRFNLFRWNFAEANNSTFLLSTLCENLRSRTYISNNVRSQKSPSAFRVIPGKHLFPLHNRVRSAQCHICSVRMTHKSITRLPNESQIARDVTRIAVIVPRELDLVEEVPIIDIQSDSSRLGVL